MDPTIELNWGRLKKQITLSKFGWTFPGILWQSTTINSWKIEILNAVTHNLWIRVTIVLKAAWTSATEQVDTIGWACSWSNSATYCTVTQEKQAVLLYYFTKADGMVKAKLEMTQVLGNHEREPHTCPCHSMVLMRIMLSGRRSSDIRIWFSWSYTDFRGTFETH